MKDSLIQNNPRLIGVGKAAKYLDLGYRKVLNLIHSGDLPAYKFGDKGYKVDINDLNDYIHKNKVVVNGQ